MPESVGARYEKNEQTFMAYVKALFELGNELDMQDALEYMDKFWTHKLVGFWS